MDISRVKIIRNPKVSWQKVEGKVVVVNPEKRKIHILYESGASIWEYLKDPKDLNELIRLICDEYDVDMYQAKRDIEEFIEKIKDKEIIVFLDIQ